MTTTTTEGAAATTRGAQPVHPRDLAPGQLVTATHPWTGHAITGRWNADHAHIEVDRADNGGCYRVTVEQLAGFTFTTA